MFVPTLQKLTNKFLLNLWWSANAMITRGREVCISLPLKSLPLQSLPLHIFTLAYPYLGVFISFWNIATSFFVRLAKSHPLQTQDAAFVASISIIVFFCLKCTNCKRCFSICYLSSGLIYFPLQFPLVLFWKGNLDGMLLACESHSQAGYCRYYSWW